VSKEPKDYQWIALANKHCECGYIPEAFSDGALKVGDKVRCLGCGRMGSMRENDGTLVIKWD